MKPNEHRPDPAMIKAVELEVAPIVFELCMKKDLKVGLEGKFSIYHAVAIGLVRGRASLDEFVDEVVADADLLRIRNLTVPRSNRAIRDDEVVVRVTMLDGTLLTKHVEHAVGNLERPMQDAELEEKLRSLAGRVIAPAQAERLIKLCWEFDRLADCRALIGLSQPV